MFDGSDDDVWTPELLDTLVDLLDDNTTDVAMDMLPMTTL
jgi:hypothetical protein